ncbi:hypothetical protein SAY86_026534 [Trapa natans]|uniref:Uncharacterized protein n=1 Tax=Trapa natans TaxID=22666 RepID=A0AAN7KDW5_TRANT|nr:hypothetical protein SAY86_026534 [Trapa natans]
MISVFFTYYSTAKLELEKLSNELEQITNLKEQICYQLLDVKRKVSALKSDFCMLIQSLELIQQEKVSLSGKVSDKSAYYTKLEEELTDKFQELQGCKEMKGQMFRLSSAMTKFNELRRMNTQVSAETTQMKQYIQQIKCRGVEYKQELRGMDAMTLQKWHTTILSDKVGEIEFIKSLQNQMGKVQGVSLAVKCTCGQEYRIELI